MKALTVSLAALTLATGAVTSAAAYPAGVQPAVTRAGDGQFTRVQYRGGGCYPGEYPRDCRERLRWEQRRGYSGRYEYRDGRYHERRRDNDNAAGAAIVGGIIGFALGAAIAGSQNDRSYYDQHRNDRSWQQRCRARYRSFDAASGTYLHNDGNRRYCRL